MEDQGPLILDISSDEEAVFGDVRKGAGCEFGDKEDGDWLSNLLVEVGGNIDDDSDDVVFLSEVLPKTLKKSTSDSAKVVIDDDDDCVVLDGDPDNRAVVASNKVACRDFPHPRHLCVKHLFASTQHEVHCAKCHCYVCDSLAPCPHWGTGMNSFDHCHANDKDEYWKSERKHVKKSDNPAQKRDKPRINSYFQAIQIPGCAPSNPNSLPKNQGLNNPVTIRPCALSSNVGLPNATNQIRSQPGYVAPSYNSRPQLVSMQHPRSTNTVAPRVAVRNRNNTVGSQNSQSFPPHAVFKRSGLTSTNNRHAYRPHLSREPLLNRLPAFQAPVTNGIHGSNQHIARGQAAASIAQHPVLSANSMDATLANYLPSKPQINSQPYSSCQNPDLIPHQSQMPSQPSPSRNSLRSPPLAPFIYSQPSSGNINSPATPEPFVAVVPDNHVPPETVPSWQVDISNAFPDRWISRSTISSDSSVGNDFGNDFSQLQEHSPTSSLACGQNVVQHQYHTQSGVGSALMDLGLICDSSVSYGSMQTQAAQSQHLSAATAETSQIQNIQHDQLRIASVVVDNRPHQSVGLISHTSPINDQPSIASVVVDNCPEQSLKLADVYTSPNGAAWALEASASPNWNVYSPEAAFTDTGIILWCEGDDQIILWLRTFSYWNLSNQKLGYLFLAKIVCREMILEIINRIVILVSTCFSSGCTCKYMFIPHTRASCSIDRVN